MHVVVVVVEPHYGRHDWTKNGIPSARIASFALRQWPIIGRLDGWNVPGQPLNELIRERVPVG